MFSPLPELATLKVLNRNFVEARDRYFDAEKMAKRGSVLDVFESERDMAADAYFYGVAACAGQFHVNHVDLAWQLTFQVEHTPLEAASV